jgi:hypothetical protein
MARLRPWSMLQPFRSAQARLGEQVGRSHRTGARQRRTLRLVQGIAAFFRSSLCHCPVAMTELDTSYSPHSGQTMLTPSIVAGICSALAPQTGQFMFLLRWLRGEIGGPRCWRPRAKRPKRSARTKSRRPGTESHRPLVTRSVHIASESIA